MTNSSDGLSWNVDTPVSASPRKDGAAEVLGLRKGIELRYEKEHVLLAAMGSGPDLATGGGEHKAGSAFPYFQTADPTQRPDAATTLTAADDGRLFVDTSAGYVLKVFDFSETPKFQNVSGTQQIAGTETVAGIVAAPVTVTVGFIPDLFWFIWGTTQYNQILVSPASLTPTTVFWTSTASEVKLKFEVIDTDDIQITLVSQTNSAFSNSTNTFWRALKF